MDYVSGFSTKVVSQKSTHFILSAKDPADLLLLSLEISTATFDKNKKRKTENGGIGFLLDMPASYFHLVAHNAIG